MIHFLSQKVFCDYEPTQFHPFKHRLLDWLNNVESDEDRQHLLALLLEVFFVGRREFEALYRTAYFGNIFRWMLEDEDADVFSDELEKGIRERINDAWICPISDSLRINSFLKVNGLKSLDKRPDWRSLRHFGDPKRIQDYVVQKNIRDLVLLEDFVGSGTQGSDAVKFAAETIPNTRILLCPLVVCPDGDEALTKLANKLGNVRYDPVLVLPSAAFHSYKNFKAGRGGAAEEFIFGLKGKLGLANDKGMFGFKQTGAKVVLFSNCPNNTIALFHHEAPTWKPLFPRVDRQ